jgi:hypothetical protein
VSAEYLEIDTESDSVDSLSAAVDFILRATDDSRYWKWVILALHSAAQGFLVLALRQDNDVLVQKNGTAMKMLAAYNEGSDFQDLYMDNFMGLYRKAQKAHNFHDGRPALSIDTDFDESIARFDQLRHALVHFNSTSRSISYELLVTRSEHCIRLIEAILVGNSIFWHEEDNASKARKNLAKADAALINFKKTLQVMFPDGTLDTA